MAGKEQTAPRRGATLRRNILSSSLISSGIETAVLIVAFVVSLLWLKSIIVENSNEMARTAAQASGDSLEAQLKNNINRHVQDIAALIDAELEGIEDITTLMGSMGTAICSSPGGHAPRSIDIAGENVPVGGKGRVWGYLSLGADRRAMSEMQLLSNAGDLLKQVEDINPSITASYFSGESGYFIITRTITSPFVNYDSRKRDWYIAAKRAGKLTWSPIYATAEGPLAITCAMPYYRVANGRRELQGVAGNRVLLRNFEQIIDAASPGENIEVILLTADGMKLFASDGTGARIENGNVISENLLKSENEGLRKLAEQMTSRQSGMSEITVDNVMHYTAYHPLRVLDWSLCIITDEDEVTLPLATLKNGIAGVAQKAGSATNKSIIIMLIAFLTLITLVILFRVLSVFVLARRIAAPVSSLARQVAETSASDLSGEVSVNSKSLEIIQLASAFNTMKTNLRKQIEALAFATAEKQKMSSEIEIASEIQRAVLPETNLPPPKKSGGGIEIGASMRPAKEVGGDLYDFFYIDGDHFAFVIGDVAGKGLPAAMLMLITQTLTKIYLQDGISVDAAINKVNAHICASNYEGRFVSMWAGVYNTQSHELDFVCAGHTPPLIQSAGGGFDYMQNKFNDIVVGVMEDFIYHPQKMRLDIGDALFLYTDGITEAFNNSDDMYGEERLCAFLNAHRDLPVKKLLDALNDDIKKFTAGAEQSDDITMLMVRLP